MDNGPKSVGVDEDSSRVVDVSCKAAVGDGVKVDELECRSKRASDASSCVPLDNVPTSVGVDENSSLVDVSCKAAVENGVKVDELERQSKRAENGLFSATSSNPSCSEAVSS